MPGDQQRVVRLYGQEVRQFSSQYSAEERMSYAAQNLAGESNIFPSYGDFTQACVFRTYGPWWRMMPSAPKPFRKTPEPHRLACEDFIEVVFSQRLYAVAVHVYETYNPGAIVRILGCDHQAGTSVDTGRKNMWRTLWSGPATETSRRARIFSPPIRRLDTPVNVIRLELNHSLLHYYTELDCIMLLGVTSAPTPYLYPLLQAQANDHPEGYPCEWPQEVDPERGGGKDEERQVVRHLESLSLADYEEDKQEKPIFDDGDDHIFALMPEEIIVMIFGYLDFPSLGCVAQTCKLLQKHAYDCILYTEINLQPVWNMVTDNTLDGLACRCHHLHRLNMSWCREDFAKYTPGFKRLLQSCAVTLTTLHLSCCSFVNQDTLYVIATTCTKLKDLDLSGCEEVDKVSAIHLTQLTELERLNLYRTQVDTHAFICIIRCLNKLKHLNFGSCKLLTNNTQVLVELGQHCPELLSVDMWRARNMDNVTFCRFVTNCHKLQELDLGWCTDLHSHGECFTTIAEKCKDLKKLFLTANRSVCNKDLNALARHSKHLEQLDLLGTREISVDAVEKVLESCKKLVMIDVSFCANILEDSVETWKVKYPHVTVKKSFQH